MTESLVVKHYLILVMVTESYTVQDTVDNRNRDKDIDRQTDT